MIGRIQSIQSFSTVDGPGTRCVVFFQGCPVGCIFCHNPDSWDVAGGYEISVELLMQKLERFRPFLQNYGLTISGGEPLVQPAFALELIKEAKASGWHIAIDTSGWGATETLQSIAENVDLIMFSFKHPLNPESVSRCNAEQIAKNWRSLYSIKKPIWLRYVLIPGFTDQPKALIALKELAEENPNLQRIEILPYNSLTQSKWWELGWDSPIFHENISVTEDKIQEIEDFFNSGKLSGKVKNRV